MPKSIDIKVEVRFKKGETVSTDDLRKPGGALDFVPKVFVYQPPPAEAAYGADETIKTYHFRAPKV